MHGLPTLSHLIHHIIQFNIVREAHLNGSSGYKMAKFILDICLLLSDDVEAGVVVDAKRSACQTQQSMHLLRDFTVLRRCTENEMAAHHYTTTYHSHIIARWAHYLYGSSDLKTANSFRIFGHGVMLLKLLDAKRSLTNSVHVHAKGSSGPQVHGLSNLKPYIKEYHSPW